MTAIGDIFDVASRLDGRRDRLLAAPRDRRQHAADLLDSIADTLDRVGADLRHDVDSHEAWGSLMSYADALPQAIAKEVGSEEAQHISDALRRSFEAQSLVADRQGKSHGKKELATLGQAAGIFRAEADSLRPKWCWTAVMRHAEALRPGMELGARSRQGALTKAGGADAAAVARRLKETLSDDGIDPSAVTVVCAPSDEAKETAAVLTEELGTGAAQRLPVLDPKGWWSTDDPKDRWKDIENEIGRLGLGDRVRVVVGHDPQMSWLLHHLVEVGGGGQRGAGPLPLGRGELAMLGGPPGKPRLRYVLSPSDEQLVAELQAKIKSKMDTAKLLGAFLTALLVFAAQRLAVADSPPEWYPWVGGAAIAALALAIAAYFVAMFRYDELLMPVRMWPSPRASGSKPPRGFVARPPSSAAWVLYQNMMHVWRYAFVPATVLGAIGAIVLTVALARPHDWWWLAVGASFTALVGATLRIWRTARPNLGVSD